MENFEEVNEMKKKSDFPPGYGEFPYILIKEGCARFIQIPIQRGEEKELSYLGCIYVQEVKEEIQTEQRKQDIEVLLWVRKKQYENHGIYLPMCLVEGPEDAVYIDEEGNISKSTSIPKGGVLLSGDKKIISMEGFHYYSIK